MQCLCFKCCCTIPFFSESRGLYHGFHWTGGSSPYMRFLPSELIWFEWVNNISFFKYRCFIDSIWWDCAENPSFSKPLSPEAMGSWSPDEIQLTCGKWWNWFLWVPIGAICNHPKLIYSFSIFRNRTEPVLSFNMDERSPIRTNTRLASVLISLLLCLSEVLYLMLLKSMHCLAQVLQHVPLVGMDQWTKMDEETDTIINPSGFPLRLLVEKIRYPKRFATVIVCSVGMKGMSYSSFMSLDGMKKDFTRAFRNLVPVSLQKGKGTRDCCLRMLARFGQTLGFTPSPCQIHCFNQKHQICRSNMTEQKQDNRQPSIQQYTSCSVCPLMLR